MNNIKLCEYTCTGDFGDRKGYITKTPLPLGTQYGQMVNIKITNTGVYLNEILVNKDVKLFSLSLTQGKKFLFKIECPKDVEHVGGFNLFGKYYGDFEQDIRFTAIYT